jgi:hypothetical protein
MGPHGPWGRLRGEETRAQQNFPETKIMTYRILRRRALIDRTEVAHG